MGARQPGCNKTPTADREGCCGDDLAKALATEKQAVLTGFTNAANALRYNHVGQPFARHHSSISS